MVNDVMRENFEWFVEHYDELFEKYGTAYLVIKDRSVIGAYASVGEAVRETEKTEVRGRYNVQYCNGTPGAYTDYIMNPEISRFFGG